MVPEQKSEREAGSRGCTKKPNHTAISLGDNQPFGMAVSSVPA